MSSSQILLVEDSADLAETMKEFLCGLGYEVFLAQNGKEALDHPQLRTVDLIIMDIEMPIMGGIEAAIKLRAAGFFPPILAYSGAVELELRADFQAASFTAYTSKPVDFQELRTLIRDLTAPESDSGTKLDGNGPSPSYA